MSESESEPDMTDEVQPDADADPDDIEAELAERDLETVEEEQAGGFADFIQAGGIKELLLQDQYQNPETGFSWSQADLVADVINVMRMDVKQMCAIHGIEVEVNKMSPERAAELLEGVAKNDGVEIIEVFEAIENKRDHVFKQELSEEEYQQYMEFKEGMLFSVGGGA
jgi:succinylglutamate desuccinylase